MAGVRSGPVLDTPGEHVTDAGGWLGLLRRAGWGVADQALSSVTNFALGVFVARQVSPREFGAFAVVFSTYLVALGLSRALASEPLLVRYTGTPAPELRRAMSSATATAVAVGAIGGAGCILAGFVAGGELGYSLIALGLVLPGLLLQDSWRFAFFASQKGRAAFANDLVWAVTLIPGLPLVANAGRASVSELILVWGGAATLAAAVGVGQARVVPNPRVVFRWLHGHRDLAPRYVGEFVALSGAYQFGVYGIGAIAGLTTVGILRAGQLLLGPLNVFSLGAGLAAVPEFVRVRRRTPARMRRASILLSAGMIAVAVTWGSLVLLIPEQLGSAALGSQWTGARTVLLPLIISRVAAEAQSGPTTALRAIAAARRSLSLRTIHAVLVIAAMLAGAALDGALGAAWGLAVAECIAAVLWWWQVLVVTPRAETSVRSERSLRTVDGETYASRLGPTITRALSRWLPDEAGYLFFKFQWFIAIRRKSWSALDERDGRAFRLLLPPSDRFYADPFLFRRGGRTYLFFEDYRYAERKAVISCAEIRSEVELGEPFTILERPYHLSYPLVFEADGEIYLLPETSARRTIELYRAVDFPRRWTSEKNLIEDIDAADTTVLSEDGTFWLFTSVRRSPAGSWDELHLYRSAQILGPWEAHPMNPVVSDARRSRSAGRFFRDRGRLIRPAQDDAARYGHAIALNEVRSLSATDYWEVPIERIEPEWLPGNLGTHHIDHDAEFEVLDGHRSVLRTLPDLWLGVRRRVMCGPVRAGKMG